MQREEKQWEMTLEQILSRLNDLKLSIGNMIQVLETQYETINWPTFLDNFALISSHLTGISKILNRRDMGGCLLRNRTFLPLTLSQDRDEHLVQIMKDVTKPDPTAEARMIAHEQKANSLNADTANKQVMQFNKVVGHISDIISEHRDKFETESSARAGIQQTSSMTDTQALVAAVGIGKGLLKMPMAPMGGGPGQVMLPPGGIRPPSMMSSLVWTKMVKKPKGLLVLEEMAAAERQLQEPFLRHGEHSNSNTTGSSEMVPNLDLTSNESYPSTDNELWYGKACEMSKMITKPDAFKAWLSAKKKSEFYESMRKKALEEELEKTKAEKKRIADEKYKEWLKKKSATSLVKKKSSTQLTSPKQTRSQEEIDHNFEQWLLKKAEYDRHLKERIREELEQKRILEDTKKKISEKIYNKWLETAPYKPKPVPMNKGLESLRGSTTEIHKNPEPWRTVIGEEVDDLSTCEEVPEMRF
uniref:Mediator of RNA polymerase II transcription subunit 8 n=1 Tax=Megaselia scalaris TaxID=36166 RepID=T1GPF8_MEGSC